MSIAARFVAAGLFLVAVNDWKQGRRLTAALEIVGSLGIWAGAIIFDTKGNP